MDQLLQQVLAIHLHLTFPVYLELLGHHYCLEIRSVLEDLVVHFLLQLLEHPADLLVLARRLFLFDPDFRWFPENHWVLLDQDFQCFLVIQDYQQVLDYLQFQDYRDCRQFLVNLKHLAFLVLLECRRFL